MTRHQVLLRARRLLEAGVASKTAVRADGTETYVADKEATNFSVIGAVQRAVFETTGDSFYKRERLYENSTSLLFKEFPSLMAAFTFFHTSTTEAVVAFINKKLTELDAIAQ